MIDLNYAKKHYSELDNAQLRALLTPNTLIPEAAQLVRAELGARGERFLEPEATQEQLATQEAADHFVTLTRFFAPTEAHLLAACLQANDIPAFVADANTVQSNLLISGALGGVRLQVPASLLDAARAIKVAYERGDFALQESDSPES
jgi:Putative prokaryotic signal transducing protein